jgi:hypothetical protein
LPGKKISPRTLQQPEGGFRDFVIEDLFDIKPTKSYNLTNNTLYATEGKTPVVCNSSLNNGIGGYVNLEPTENGNIITYSDTTTSDAIFYQPNPFIGYSHVQGLYPKDEIWDEKSLLYFIAAFKKTAAGRFDYANKFNRALALKMHVYLPVTKCRKPDIDYMRSRMRELFELRMRELFELRMRELEAYLFAAGFENCELSEQELSAVRSLENGEIKFVPMKIYDTVFKVTNSHNILKSSVQFGSGSTPYVTAGVGNNSIAGYISYNEDMLEPGNSIMIGGKTMVITYQPNEFFSNDSHNLVLRYIDREYPTENQYLFGVAALYKSLSHIYSWGDSISKAKIQKDVVCMPVDEDGDIDFVLMDNLINAVKKNVIARLKPQIAKEQRDYKRAINS